MPGIRRPRPTRDVAERSRLGSEGLSPQRYVIEMSRPLGLAEPEHACGQLYRGILEGHLDPSLPMHLLGLTGLGVPLGRQAAYCGGM